MEQLSITLEKIKDIPLKYKCLAAGTTLALISIFSLWEKDTPQKSNIIETNSKNSSFELVNTRKEQWNDVAIYKYKLEKWDYPFLIANKFNTLDAKKWDKYTNVSPENMLDQKKQQLKKNQNFDVGDIVYIKAVVMKEKPSVYTYHFSRPENNYEYRSKREKSSIETITKKIEIDGKKESVTLIKDAWLIFYVVNEDDFFPHTMHVNEEKIKHCIDFEKIRRKIMKIDGFSYLKDPIYQRAEQIDKKKINLKNKITSFNINPMDISKIEKKDIRESNFFIPIPIEEDKRIMSIENFWYYAQQAIKEIEKNEKYKSMIKELLTKVTREEILEALLTYAYCESGSAEDNQLGKFELHRREWMSHRAFSFSYFHVLMTKWSPGYKARINLWLTEWECYHPKNATKLFLAFWAEKAKESSKPLSNYFPLNTQTYEKVACTYNWWSYKKNKYDIKIKTNHQKVMKLLKPSKKK